MSVKICGAVLSSIYYENSNSSSDQEGLLLGRITSHVVDTISDSQISNLKENITIDIYAFLRCGVGLSWYDNCGRVDMNKLRAFVPKNASKDIIGWYKFRRNCRMAVSLRDRAVHKSLMANLPNRVQEHFVFLLCGSDEMVGQNTHTFTHVFHTLGTNGQGSLSCEVLNLGDTSHNEYKRADSRIDAPNKAFTEALKPLSGEFCTKDGQMHSVSSVNHLMSSVQSQLQKLCSGVARSEDTLGKLRSEMKEMRNALIAKRTPAADTKITKPTTVSSNPQVSSTSRSTTAATSASAKSGLNLPPRQRLSGSAGSIHKPRRLSDFEFEERQFDVRDSSDAVAMETSLPEENLICFEDAATSDNLRNQALDSAANGFEDSFVPLDNTVLNPISCLMSNPMQTQEQHSKPKPHVSDNQGKTQTAINSARVAQSPNLVAKHAAGSGQNQTTKKNTNMSNNTENDPFTFLADIHSKAFQSSTIGKRSKEEARSMERPRSKTVPVDNHVSSSDRAHDQQGHRVQGQQVQGHRNAQHLQKDQDSPIRTGKSHEEVEISDSPQF